MEMTLTPGAPSTTAAAVAARAQGDRESVRSVERAATILMSLSTWTGSAGVTDLARSVGMHKSTTSRLLSTLMSRGLVEQDAETGKYKLGRALILLGLQAEKALDIRSIALPELQRLARSVKETATLGVLLDDEVTTVAWCDESGMSRDRAGRRWPLHATAPGKVLLTNRPEREIIRLSRSGLTPYSPSTIVRVEVLLEELARVRQRGFAREAHPLRARRRWGRCVGGRPHHARKVRHSARGSADVGGIARTMKNKFYGNGFHDGRWNESIRKLVPSLISWSRDPGGEGISWRPRASCPHV